MQLAFAQVRIIYDTITSVLFWVYDFSERMILCVYDLCAYDLCAYDISVRMIFSEHMICVRMIFLCVWFFLSVWFVYVWFFCGYDFHDHAPVHVSYRKNTNKWTMYSYFLNVCLWNLRILLLTQTFTWGVHVWSGGRGSENRPVRPIPPAVPWLYGAFSN